MRSAAFALNPYSDIDIEFDNLKLSSLLNLRANYIDTKYTRLYAAYIKYIKDIIHYEARNGHTNHKTLNAIYKMAKLHNEEQIMALCIRAKMTNYAYV